MKKQGDHSWSYLSVRGRGYIRERGERKYQHYGFLNNEGESKRVKDCPLEL